MGFKWTIDKLIRSESKISINRGQFKNVSLRSEYRKCKEICFRSSIFEKNGAKEITGAGA